MKSETMLEVKSFQSHIVKRVLINYEYKFYIIICFVFHKATSLRCVSFMNCIC